LLGLPAFAEESPALLLERAIQLHAAAGDTAAAATLYEKIVEAKGNHQRTRAEALFRLAEMRAREARHGEARNLYTRLIREFPEVQDLIPLANEAWSTETALLTQDQFATNPAATHRIGDLVIALRGALENAAPKGRPVDAAEVARAGVLLQRLDAALAAVTVGSDAVRLLIQLKAGTNKVADKLQTDGPAAARETMTAVPEFEPFMLRGFPADPHDLFAPAWRVKDKLARALAGEGRERAGEIAAELEKYLAPMATLPTGLKEASLARAIVSAMRDVRRSIAARNWTEALARIDELNEERHEQYAGFHPVANALPMRMPERYVAAEWVVLHFTELARLELSRRGVADALYRIGEARKVCLAVLPGLDHPEVSALFKHQEEALSEAEAAISSDRFGPALQALKRVGARTP
jgi:hypothetical protein